MGDWDPFAEPGIDAADNLSAPASQVPALQVPRTSAGANGYAGGGEARLTREDMDQIIKEVEEKLRKDKPWLEAPDPTPDLTWHTPTCTAEDWRHKDVKFEMSDGIAYVIFNRPNENNTMNETLSAGINDSLFALHARPDFRVAVFTGEGKMYCAGGDPKGWQAQAAAARGEKVDGDGTVGHRFPLKPMSGAVLNALKGLGERALAAGAFPDGNVDVGRIMAAKQWHTWATLPQFTICLVNGSAMGGGVGCVCCCDMAISVKKAFFMLSEVKLGVIPATISPYVIGKIGTANAKRLFCTAENMRAERAKEVGLVNEVVENMEEGHKLIRELCKSLTLCGPNSVTKAKRLITGVANQPITESLMFYTARMLAEVTISDEAKAGMIAIQVREPKPWEAKPIKPLY